MENLVMAMSTMHEGNYPEIWRLLHEIVLLIC
jgi:hypothetical protein